MNRFEYKWDARGFLFDELVTICLCFFAGIFAFIKLRYGLGSTLVLLSYMWFIGCIDLIRKDKIQLTKFYGVKK